MANRYRETSKKRRQKRAQKEQEKQRKKGQHRALKTFLKILLLIVLLAALIYGAGVVFFSGHFYYGTKINGTDCSMKSAADVENFISEQITDYKLTLEELEGKEEIIVGEDVGVCYKKGTQIEDALKTQDAFKWPLSLTKTNDLTVNLGADYDEEKLDEALKDLDCMDKKSWTKPKNAYPVYDDGEYVIQKEVYGTAIDKKALKEKVGESIAAFEPTLNLEEAGCYKKPKFTASSEKVKKACKKLNKYSKASITYTFGKKTEVVDRSVIKDWLKVSKKTMKVTYDEEQVTAYIAGLAAKYDTVDKTRKFKSKNGNVYEVPAGTYGWMIDQATEVEALKALIREGKTVEKEPAYATKAARHGKKDWGKTYAEVSISQQHMWYVKDGKTIFEADVVTGLPTPKKATPTGMHMCLEKEENRVLKGEIQANGKREYETPVAYWMRITWSGVGFHTATWQPSFGGNRYTYAGSHGCVNMSYTDSQTLYGIIQVGDPVIIHD